MTIPTPQLAVLIMDDGREFGDQACNSIPRVRPASVRLAVQGAPDRPGVRTAATVAPEKFTVRTAIKTAAAEGLFLIAAPKNVQDPLSVFVDAARGAASELDGRHPGFALAFVEPGFEFTKIAAVADLRDPVTTGLSAWAAVALASQFGTRVDVLVLGAEATEEPQNWRDGMARFNFSSDGEELVRDALERAVQHGLELNWKPLGSPMDKPAAILRAIAEEGYDFVVDDLPPITLGAKPGRRRRVQAALTQAGSNATAYRLLRDAPCGVVVVLDAARLGLVSEDLVRAGAATLALGVVGVGAAAAGRDEMPDMAAAMPAVEQSAATEAVGSVQAAPTDISMMTEADLAVMQQQLGEAMAQRDAAAAELSAQQAQAEQKQAELAALQAQEDAIAPHAEQARQEAQEASRESTYKQIMTSGPLALLPGGPSQAEAQQARQRAEATKQQADALESELKAIDESQQQLTEHSEQLNASMAQVQEQVAASEQSVSNLSQTTSDLAWQLNPVVIPVADGFYISVPFGQRGPYWSSGYHTGLDFAHSTGADVFAAKSGVVVEAGWGGAYGNNIVIQHEDGTRTRYAHLSSINVSAGQSVSAGQHIGDVGATGNVTGPHLHFEVMDSSGNFMDPARWLGM